MAHIVNNILHLESGHQIPLTGRAIAILPTLELAECFTINFFGLETGSLQPDMAGKVQNLYRLSRVDLVELSAYMVGLWTEFTINILTKGIEDTSIFRGSSS